MKDFTQLKKTKKLELRIYNFDKKEYSKELFLAMKFRYANCFLQVDNNDLVCKINYVSRTPEFDEHFEKKASDYLLRMVIKYEM